MDKKQLTVQFSSKTVKSAPKNNSVRVAQVISKLPKSSLSLSKSDITIMARNIATKPSSY
jgi:hypothetical protein